MSWPTSSKATTTHTDSPGDNPQNARAEIKQDIDNVNAIIDTFDISSPVNNDTLAYNGATGKFTTGIASSLNVSAIIFYRFFETGISGNGTDSDGRRNNQMRKLYEIDPFGLVSFTGDDRFVLGAGEYIIECHGAVRSGNASVGSPSYNDLNAYSNNKKILFNVLDQSITGEDLAQRDDGQLGSIFDASSGADNQGQLQQLYHKTISSGTRQFVPFAKSTDAPFDGTATPIQIKIIKVGG